MALPIEHHTDKELNNLVEDHRKQNALSTPNYISATEELARRRGKGLDFKKSLS